MLSLKFDEEFKWTLIEAIDEGLRSIVGENGKKVIYYHLKELYGLEREEISEKLEVFAEYINKIFGLGARIIEIAIIKALCLKLKLEYREKKVKFVDYIEELYKEYMKKYKKK